MQRRATYLAAIALAGLALLGVGEARADQQRPNGWGRRHAVTSAPSEVNTSATVQEGRGNAASVVQDGTGNAAGIRQFGRDNTGAIMQVGSNNAACLIQAGRNLDGAIQQVGDNKSNGLLQTRWGSTEIPVAVCATAMTREDVMAYAPERPENTARVRLYGRGRSEP